MIQNNVCYMFNKVYLNLMKEIKDKNPDIKSKLKSNYKIFDKKSNEYITKMVMNMNDTVTEALFGDEDILDKIEIINFELFVDITIDTILKKVVDTDGNSRNSLKYYVYILMVFGYIYKMDDLDDVKKDILLKKTVDIINSVDTDSISNEEELEKHLEDILDDDLRKLLMKMYVDRTTVKESVMKLDTEDIDTGLEFLNNTRIGELAKEISSSIDMSKINMENPEEMLNMNNLFSGSNNMLGDIIQTVGTKITQKIQNGDINQEELMGEALNMMGTLNSSGHGDMMSQMMGMMSGMGDLMGKSAGGASSAPTNKTRERLQNKLANKKI